jgi:hypothetical protein
MYYKAFRHGSKVGKYQSRLGSPDVEYEVGGTYAIKDDEKPVLCAKGYHACAIAVHCFRMDYGYKFHKDVLGIIELSGDIVCDDIKSAGRKMTITRILTREEMYQHCTGTLVNDYKFICAHDAMQINSIPTDCPQEWYRECVLHRDGDKPALIDITGLAEWYVNGKLHRDDDKPARIQPDGSMEWYVNGKFHRLGDKPAKIIEVPSGVSMSWMMYWMVNGRSHRDDDNPAIISDLYMQWYTDGKLNRDCDDKPASISQLETSWFVNDKLHRLGDKPASVQSNGNLFWYINGFPHREGDKPAVISSIFRMEWYNMNKLHREGSKPAVIHLNGTCMDWYVNGMSTMYRRVSKGVFITG